MISKYAPKRDQKGFTLVEILISLLILGLILVGILPLLTMANRIMYQNRDQLVATQLARDEIETISSQVTPQNYNDPYGPLVPGVHYRYLDRYLNEVEEDSPLRVYTVTTSIGWVDDADDKEAPDDPIPFDYKYLQVSVSAPSIFTGLVTERSDFKTYRAREGAADPIAGVLVQVERAWREEPSVAPPVEGALVTVTAESNGASFSSMTDSKGRALIELNPSGSGDIQSYHITASKAGMILHPEYPDGKDQDINRYSTQTVVLQMEEPASIILSLNEPHFGGKAILTGGNLLPSGEPLEAVLSSEATQVRFDNLWPVGEEGNISGSYSLETSLKIYENVFTESDLNSFVRWEEDDPAENIYNLWTFDAANLKWKALSAPGSPAYNRLGLDIENLNRFLPGSGFQIKSEEGVRQIFLGAEDFNIEPGYEDDSYKLIYKSREVSPLSDLIQTDEGWETVGTLAQALEAVADDNDDDRLWLDSDDLSTDSMKLRFDASAAIDEISFGPLFIQAAYVNPNITFAAPGQTLTLSVFAGSP
jgi:prepilin-type N-terminal cleavage/methylation domain-containing protein